MRKNNHRAVHFDGAKNVRDLGGLATADGSETRFGVIYRADGLSRLNAGDLERLAALRLSSIIDLRYPEERERAPDRLPVSNPPAFYHRGFLPRGSAELFAAVNEQGADAATACAMMAHNYSRIPFEHSDELRDVLHYVIESGRAPHLIHCTSGKDRTGLVVALLLLALGVSEADVLHDYALSNGAMQPVDIFSDNADPGAVAVIMQAREEYLRAALEAIETRCGGVGPYLADVLGFGDPEQAQLRALMLG